MSWSHRVAKIFSCWVVVALCVACQKSGGHKGDGAIEPSVTDLLAATCAGDAACNDLAIAPPVPSGPFLVLGEIDDVPTYWRDGVATSVTESGLDINLFAALIDQAGNSIVAGSHRSTSGPGPSTSAYWVNGTRNSIKMDDDGVVRAVAQDPVSGKLLFGGGANQFSNDAAYWIEGDADAHVVVSSTHGVSAVRGVAADAQGNVHAAGVSPQFILSTPNGDIYKPEGFIFLNNPMHFQPTAPADSAAIAIHVAASGNIRVLLDSQPSPELLTGTWHPSSFDNTSDDLQVPTSRVYSSGMAVDGSENVYVSAYAVGSDLNARESGYFVNGTWNSLGSGASPEAPSGIAVDSSGHILVSGTLSSNGKLRAGYWIDKIWVPLTDGSETKSLTKAIFVK